ncbi:hypothetical protein COMA2_70028 [Candidatus Nitrospira nitrificans]|uniref:Uncharacterized protein n=1 Tax=Candidatus Nitrospira nitrificans TaxID=1742973 RepID=A0A0S4LPM9_9BACT|nr:hypothetical protein COMA2_70028 [Candidatus Nitrospira nitrificans]
MWTSSLGERKNLQTIPFCGLSFRSDRARDIHSNQADRFQGLVIDQNGTPLLGCLGAHMVATILLDQGINDQPTIKTAQNHGTGRDRRLTLVDHQTFAFQTSHASPSC